jgi:hypothetical protein
MIRLRRTSVIAALSLLVWAATASAECAWVLWDGQLSNVLGQDMLWSVNGTYSTAKDRNTELARYVVVKEQRGDEVSSPRAGIAPCIRARRTWLP